MRRSHLSVTALAFTISAVHGPARAQQCDRPDLVDTVPADDASGVPTNARLVAHYDPRAEYLGEPVLFGVAGGELEEIPAVFNENEGLVEATPPAELERGERYRVEWPRLRGVGTASLGSGQNVEFTAGDGPDVAPPRFEGLLDVTWDLDRQRDDCIERRNDRLRFEFELDHAEDDGGRDSLSLVVFQTAGPDIDDSVAAAPVLVRAYPGDDRASLRLPVSDAVGRVCFAAIARDLAGFVSASGGTEACTETRPPPFFQGCRLSHTRGPLTTPWVLCGSLVALSARRRRTARRRRGRP